MFHWNKGLYLTRAGLAVDIQRRQPSGFISHAHADHMGRHELALCTPETAALYRHRLGDRPVKEMPYREPIDWAGLRLTTYPSGHCLGSAMLLAEDGDDSMLYTGDFKLEESATAQRAELPRAKNLVMECTFGQPGYRLPPREDVIAELLSVIDDVLASRRVPVIIAYTLGKSQEVTKILTDNGHRVLQHPKIYEISQVYEWFGVDFGNYGRLSRDYTWPQNEVLVVPPRTALNLRFKTFRIAVSGWAAGSGAKYRFGVDHAVPLSDHADYDDLFEAVRIVQPECVYCTHGPDDFVHRLCEEGFNAKPLGKAMQQRLF